MTPDDFKALLEAVSKTTNSLLQQSNQRLSNSGDGNLGAVASHLGLSATGDALNSLRALVDSGHALNESQLEILSIIANRIGDAGRAAFSASDAGMQRGEDRASIAVRDVCSFCGKSDIERPRMIHGPAVAICDECVARANLILT